MDGISSLAFDIVPPVSSRLPSFTTIISKPLKWSCKYLSTLLRVKRMRPDSLYAGITTEIISFLWPCIVPIFCWKAQKGRSEYLSPFDKLMRESFRNRNPFHLLCSLLVYLRSQVHKEHLVCFSS